MGVDLTKRDASRLRTWHVGLLALLLAMAFGGMHAGASWGASAYDPSADPYSMQNVTAGDGTQSWWNAGYTGKGVDVAVIDTGVAPVAGLNGPGKVVNGPAFFIVGPLHEGFNYLVGLAQILVAALMALRLDLAALVCGGSWWCATTSP